MTKRILIDGVHAEESRVVVAEGDRLEEFDFENIEKKQIKNSIYLGKITRIEPSLQAAFVEYGGNRQGFLPFSEIHPDYFHIPLSDQEKEQSDSVTDNNKSDNKGDNKESGKSSDTEKESKNSQKSTKNTEKNNESEDNLDQKSESKGQKPEVSKNIDSNEENEGKEADSKKVDSKETKKATSRKRPVSKKKDEKTEDSSSSAASNDKENEDSIDKSIDESLSDEDENNTIAADAGEESKSTTIKIGDEDKEAASKDVKETKKATTRKRPATKKKDGKSDDASKDEGIKKEEELSETPKPKTRRKILPKGKSKKKIDDSEKVISEIDISSKKKAEFLARRYSEKDWLSDESNEADSDYELPAGSIKKGRSADDFNKKKDADKNASDSGESDEQDQEEIEVDNINEDIEENTHSGTDVYKKYKIQEVLKRGQVILVQVIKEERGNKGASLTSYISLAGRYCVLMPNSEKSGGVSRRISDVEDRKRLKKIVDGLDNSDKMSVIVRTAGINKEQTEIERDYDNLRNLWRKIKTTTMDAKAPELIYEDGNLIKSTLRDMYRGDVEEIIVEGDKAHKDAVRYMEMMAPEDIDKVKLHKDNKPLFKSWNIESQLDELYNNEAILPSGGSIVISPTEALVSIDVNSGKATKEKNIEDTALKTNIEAAKEVARQLRLRDLAGLVVIDFIDMRDIKNRRAVEKAMKDALKVDRAKIQVGRISLFGLMEMSRQRMRSSIVEASSITCPHCKGNGVVRSNESVAINLLRAIEAEASKNNVGSIVIRTSASAALYLLNNKREELIEIEKENNVVVEVVQDQDLLDASYIIDKQRKGKSAYNKKSNSKYNKKTPTYRGAKSKYNKNKFSDNNKADNDDSDFKISKNSDDKEKVEKDNNNNTKNEDEKKSYKEKGNNKKPSRPPRKNNYKDKDKDKYPKKNSKEKPISDDIGNRIEESKDTASRDSSPKNETVVDANESSKIRNIWNKMTK